MEMVNAKRIMIDPVFTDSHFNNAEFNINIINDAAYPMATVLRFGKNPQLGPEVVEYHKVIQPNSMETLTVPVNALKKVRTDDITPLTLFTWFGYQYEDGREVNVDDQYKIAPVRKEFMPESTVEIVCDGKLDEWPALPYHGGVHSEITGDAKEYDGDYDANFSFGVLHDDQYMYVGISVWDDELVLNKKALLWEKDAVRVFLDARPASISANNKGENRNKDFLYMNCSPDLSKKQDHNIDSEIILSPGTLIRAGKTIQGFDMELAIPIEFISSNGGVDWESLRVNLAYFDHDENSSLTGIWWKPDWSSRGNYIGSGIIFRKK